MTHDTGFMYTEPTPFVMSGSENMIDNMISQNGV